MKIEKMRILVVDDTKTMRTVVRNRLVAMGATLIDTAEDGRKALDKIIFARKSGRSYDLILSDWNMPEMDGLELLKALKDSKHYKDIPFLLITAVAEHDYVEKAIVGGASGYMVKPFTPQVFNSKVEKILGLRGISEKI